MHVSREYTIAVLSRMQVPTASATIQPLSHGLHLVDKKLLYTVNLVIELRSGAQYFYYNTTAKVYTVAFKFQPLFYFMALQYFQASHYEP